MPIQLLRRAATVCSGAAILLAAVMSCSSGKPELSIEGDITTPQMTVGETATAGPQTSAGNTQTQTTAPPTLETTMATPPVTASVPSDFAHPH